MVPNRIWHFHRDEEGAITVDWVVLTAAVVTLGLFVGPVVLSGTRDVANSIADKIIGSGTGK